MELNRTVVFVVVAIVLVVAAGILIFAFLDVNPPSADQNPSSGTGGLNPPPAEQVRIVNVSGRPFSFTPSEIRVRRGDRVRIVFTNEQGTHDWSIDEFGARTPVLREGETSQVEFTADRIGQFEYYCSVGNHRQMGMRGLLIVE